jgi:hypothetical protein
MICNIHGLERNGYKWRLDDFDGQTGQTVQPMERTPQPYSSTKWWAETLCSQCYGQKSIQDTIAYLHACCFRPITDTWLKSIPNGHFATWPSVTVENVRKYLGKSDATAMGNLNQIRQNIRSTQQFV